MKLSRVDKSAIQNFDDIYLLKKGISFFYDQDYEIALEFFHLAISMGNIEAIGYVGYSYIMGYGVPEEADLGLSYYKVAVEFDDIKAIYDLGKLYYNGTGVEKDVDLAIYYYKRAMNILEGREYNEWLKYPELFYLIANEMLPGGKLREDINKSYELLLTSKEGYELAIKNGAFYFEGELEKVNSLINNSIYKNIKNSIEKAFKEE